jgi:DNA processing protein
VVSELAVAAFAARTGRHLVRRPAGAEFAAFARGFDERAYRDELAGGAIRWLPRSDRGFPPRLRSIHDPPTGLFVRGARQLDLLSAPSVAIVGARGCSSYGAHVARALGRELASAGLVVVSGLARGVDGEAHRGALESGGPTVGVLGCGIDRDYPAAHRELAARMLDSGLIVSEYAPGVEPAPWRFPARNRIVAGLALAVVVVEARDRSGALITADFALEEGREVFAVPGEITSGLSRGTNGLLKLGAAPLTCAGDVLEALGVDPPRPDPSPVTPGAAAILEHLRDGASGADELVRATGFEAAVVAIALSELELDGVVAQADGAYRVVMPAK